DWFAHLKELLAANGPDLVVITLGANDTQDIVVEGRKRHLVASEGWNEIYGQRVTRMANLAAEAGANVLWLGLPVMGREPYNARVQNLNRVTKEACEKEDNCAFWDASRSLTDANGKYSAFVTAKDGRHVKARAKDSIHLTEEGGKQMLADLLDDSPYLTAEVLKGLSPEGQAYAQAESLAPSAGSGAETGLAPDGQAVTVSLVSGPLAPKPLASGQATLAQNDVASPGAEAKIGQPFVPLGPPPAEGEAPAGPFAVSQTVLSSTSRGQTSYLVLAPVGAPSVKLPAVLLLHGAEGDQNYFPNGLGQGLSDLATRYGIVFIMPDGGPFGWYLDSPLKADSQIATYVMGELMPDALARYPIDPDRVGVLGISMGGHGALTLALANPGLFKAVSTISAVIDLESHKSDSSLDRYLRLHEILGPSELAQDVWRQHSAYFLTRKNYQALKGVPLMMSVGLSDKLCLAENRQFDRLLADLGLRHYYVERSGGHGWAFWRSEFPAHLSFLADSL
ncbi:MAG: DUF459 domain-containing protein, partial [Deltaproteobacteria bacterium]|nr:DUF459 domain-containing protein [Deltaproteobacteria bacterium]